MEGVWKRGGGEGGGIHPAPPVQMIKKIPDKTDCKTVIFSPLKALSCAVSREHKHLLHIQILMQFSSQFLYSYTFCRTRAYYQIGSVDYFRKLHLAWRDFYNIPTKGLTAVNNAPESRTKLHWITADLRRCYTRKCFLQLVYQFRCAAVTHVSRIVA